MDKKQRLNQFLEEITLVVKNSFVTFGTPLAALGVTNASEQVGKQLHADSMAFARAYLAADAEGSEVRVLADKMAGSLLTGQSLGVIHERKVNELLDQLEKLMEIR